MVAYSEFEHAIENKLFNSITISGQKISGSLKQARDGKTVMVATIVDPALAARLDKHEVPYTRIEDQTLLKEIMTMVVPALFMFALWFFLFRNFAKSQGMSEAMSLGKSGAKVYIQTNTGITFADVAGVDEAKSELQEVVDFLKRPSEFQRLGAHIPKGVLLVGPPGTGKTLLAKAVAGEACVPFFSISGSEFVEMFVGVGAARVRDLFTQARQHAPAIIFIDELDALGRARGAMPGLSGHDEKEQTLNQLLSEMDGFDSSGGLIILSATNRPEILDPALLRAGRFDRQVLVDRPDRKGRVDILSVHTRKIKLDPDLRLDTIAALTPGFSGADLANLVNEAALVATRMKANFVSETDFTAAVERIVAGLEHRSRILSKKEREAVAYHEMGHVIVALAHKDADRVHKVSIIPRGLGALGYTIQRPSEDRYLMTQSEIEQKIAVLLGGRAAEKLVFNMVSTGAADDLAKASDLARDMVTRYGMDEHLGHVAFEPQRNQLLDISTAIVPSQSRVSPDTLKEIDTAIQRIISKGFKKAYSILEDNRAVLNQGATQLLDQETLDEFAIKTIAANLSMKNLADT